MEPQQNRRTAKQDTSIAGLYDMESSLGSGHFAIVKLARHVFTGEKVAIKVIDKNKLDGLSKDHLYQEVQCMKLVQHPNVVRLYEVIDTQTKLYLILEYGDGGDMYDHIMKYEGQGISENKARHYFKQIVSAIDYCHKLHVVHRDLKPENVIFFKSQDLAKLTDFGFSNNYLPGEKLFTSCGSLAYSAPEILLGDSYDAPAVDVWSLGVILYMMVCGQGPFNHANDSETLTMIMDCKYELPDTLSEDCKRLIQRMLVRLPSKRATLESIVNDKWLSGGGGAGKALSLSPTPLISEIKISRNIHMTVLQRMELGRIASKEIIEKCLQSNEYNHITATYFLVAERILKKIHGKAALHVRLEESHSAPYDKTSFSDSPCEGCATSSHHITESEDMEDAIKTLVAETESLDEPIPFTNYLTREQSQSDECLTDSSASSLQDFQLHSLQPRAQRKTYPSVSFSKQKTKSTPNLLNEISEEHESELEDSPRTSPLLQRRSSQRRTKYHTCRLSPIHSRRSSCSSSDDDEMHMLVEKLRLSQQKLAQAANNQSGSQPSDKNTSDNNSSDNSNKRNTTPPLVNGDTISDKNLANLLLPALTLKLASLGNYTHGKHLSDTNLTSYSEQLLLALSKGSFKAGKLQPTKCSSDTNLVSTLFKKKQYLSQDLLKTKELFVKYFKRGWKPGKTASSLSLSSPIEEEPSYDNFHMEPGPNIYSSSEDLNRCCEATNMFNRLTNLRTNPSFNASFYESESRNSFFKSDKPHFKYHHENFNDDDFTNESIIEDYTPSLHGCTPQPPTHVIPTVTTGSACCSLV